MINKKFLIVLLLVVVVGGAAVGGLFALQQRSNVQRHLDMGEQFMAEGNYRDAFGAYGRAVAKDPANIDYLRKYEAALLKITPENRDDARQLYSKRVTVLNRAVRYHEIDPEMHIELIEELLFPARLTNQAGWWQEIADAADTMWDAVPPDDPKQLHARLYKAMSVFGQALLEEPQELMTPVERLGIEAELEVEDELLQFLEANPESDLGWATLIRGQLVMSEKLRDEGRDRRATDWLEKAGRTMAAASKAAPEGPSVAREAALYEALRFTADADAIGSDRLDQAIHRAIELNRVSDDPVLVAAMADLLRTLGWLGYLPQAIDLLVDYVDRHPDALFHRSLLGKYQYKNGELDAADRQAQALIDTELQTVSFMSQFQDQIQKRATGLQVDVAFRRWELAEEADRAEALVGLDAAMERFEQRVTDRETDPLYHVAQGKLALAHEDYRLAAARFDQLSRLPGSASVEILSFAAYSLEKAGSIGLALERILQILQLQPTNTTHLYEAARLAYQQRRFQQAGEMVGRLLVVDPEHLLGRRLHSILAVEQAGGAGEELDPFGQALVDALAAMQAGKLDSARATLATLLEQDPNNIQALDAMLQVEMAAGDSDRAMQYLDRLQALQPTNKRLRQVRLQLTIDDPIERVEKFIESSDLAEGERAVALAINLSALSLSYRQQAQRLRAGGDETAAAELELVADDADNRSATYLEEAERLVPADATLLEYKFRAALAENDWTTADALVQRARDTNADLAGGNIYAGQLALLRGETDEAIRLLEEGTSLLPFSSTAWQSLALAYERTGNFGRAKEAYSQAYLINPNDIDTVRSYGQLLIQGGDDARALRLLRTARRLVPNDARLRDVWLGLESKTGDRGLVLTKRRQIYEATPNDRTNAGELATLLATVEPARDLILEADGSEKYPEGLWLRLPSTEKTKEIEETRRQWHLECDAILDALEADSPDDLQVVALRAMLLRERGQIDEGEQVLADLISRVEDAPVNAFVALAQYQYAVGRADRAVATLEGARGRQDPEDPVVDRVLGDFFFRQGRYNDAIAVFTAMLQRRASDEAELRIIECHERAGQYVPAQRLLQKRLDRGEDGYYEQMLGATIADGYANQLIVEGQPEKAQAELARRDESLTNAERLNPSHPQPHISRAASLLRAYRRQIAAASLEEADRIRRETRLLDDALRSFDRADEIRAGATLTSLTRVTILQAKQDVAAAIAELSRLLERAPDQIGARRLLVQLHYAQGNINAAVDSIRDAIERNPTLAVWHELEGELYLRRLKQAKEQGSPSRSELANLGRKALDAFSEALTLEPSPGLVHKAVTVYFSLQPPDHAAAVRVLSGVEPLLNTDPTLRSVYALALHGQGEATAAMEQLELAYGQFKERGARETATGDITDWFDVVQRIHKDQPMQVEPFIMRLARNQPDYVDLRLLARHWASLGSQGVSRALELHQQAIRSHAARDPRVQQDLYYDLARYYILDGQYEQAITALDKVLEISPDHKLALNNQAYLLTTHVDRPQDARSLALRLVGLLSPTDSPLLQTTILDTVGWVHYRLGELNEAETYLRRAVDIQETASNQFHLAQLLADTNRTNFAEVHLRRASELSPDDETKREIEALAADIRTSKD